MNEGIQKRKSWDIIPEGGNGREAARAATNPPPRFKKKQKPFLLADGRVNGRDRVMSLLLGPDLQPWFGVCVLFVSCGWGHAGPLLFPAGNRGINTWLIASCKWIPLFPQTTTARVHLLFLSMNVARKSCLFAYLIFPRGYGLGKTWITTPGFY